MMKIQVFGDPVAQPRHKVTIRGNYPHAYIPGNHKIHGWKELIRLTANRYFKKPLTGAVEIDIQFVLAKPKNIKTEHHIKKPDIDNLIKGVLDALNGLAYKDDSQIYKLSAIKLYGSDRGILIDIEEVK